MNLFKYCVCYDQFVSKNILNIKSKDRKLYFAFRRYLHSYSDLLSWHHLRQQLPLFVGQCNLCKTGCLISKCQPACIICCFLYWQIIKICHIVSHKRQILFDHLSGRSFFVYLSFVHPDYAVTKAGNRSCIVAYEQNCPIFCKFPDFPIAFLLKTDVANTQRLIYN